MQTNLLQDMMNKEIQGINFDWKLIDRLSYYFGEEEEEEEEEGKEKEVLGDINGNLKVSIPNENMIKNIVFADDEEGSESGGGGGRIYNIVSRISEGVSDHALYDNEKGDGDNSNNGDNNKNKKRKN